MSSLLSIADEDVKGEDLNPPHKRIRVESNSTDEVESTEDETAELIDPTESDSTELIDSASVLCAICMGSNGEDIKLLENHNCPVCVEYCISYHTTFVI